MITIPAAGILTNDTDVEGSALTVVPGSGTTHGGLILNANGGFTYTPVSNYFGSDSFTYRANDGTTNPVTKKAANKTKVNIRSFAVRIIIFPRT